MSNKLASAIFCIGIAVGTLSAPRSSRLGGRDETTQSDVKAKAVAVSIDYNADARPSAQSATNTITTFH